MWRHLLPMKMALNGMARGWNGKVVFLWSLAIPSQTLLQGPTVKPSLWSQTASFQRLTASSLLSLPLHHSANGTWGFYEYRVGQGGFRKGNIQAGNQECMFSDWVAGPGWRLGLQPGPAGTLISDFQPPELWEANVCCLSTQFMLLCYSSLS